MATVKVALGERSYEVFIEAGSSAKAASYLPEGAAPGAVFIITDENVAALYLERVRASFAAAGPAVATAVIPAGETEKNLSRVEWLYHRMLEAGLDRKSIIVALGGGVVGDVAGFAAATYMRGIAFVQIPTTIVAQVDSSVGGKTGVDLAEGKNLIGAFHQPAAVVIDPETLSTLPRRETSAGLAEVIKHGVILDADYFKRLEDLGQGLLEMDAARAGEVVRRSVEIKAEVVSRDEREAGLRAILNFGHTVGHALEALTGYSRFLHGEAVAIGMVAACRIGREAGLCGDEPAERVSALCALAGLPISGEGFSAARVAEAFARDKKSVRGAPRFVLPEEIGRVKIGCEIAPETVAAGLRSAGFGP